MQQIEKQTQQRNGKSQQRNRIYIEEENENFRTEKYYNLNKTQWMDSTTECREQKKELMT